MLDEISLYEFALAQAKASLKARRLRQVSKATTLGYWWLRAFARGQIPNAGVRKIETLARHYRANPATAEAPAPSPPPSVRP